jgi:DNA helicase HerA-like ATPase
LFVFDEAQEFVRDLTKARGIERDCSEKVETLLRQGRKYGLGGCIATQRIAYLNTNALQQLQDPDKYRSYTPQHKIGKSLNKGNHLILEV